MVEEATYLATETAVTPGSTLILYSDGAFDFVTKAGPRFSHPEFLDLIDGAMEAGLHEAREVEEAIRELLREPTFEDDFSLLMLEFE